jgi:hypothetical protein
MRVRKALKEAAWQCEGDLDHYYYGRNNRRACRKLVSWRNRIDAILKSVEKELDIARRYLKRKRPRQR